MHARLPNCHCLNAHPLAPLTQRERFLPHRRPAQLPFKLVSNNWRELCNGDMQFSRSFGALSPLRHLLSQCRRSRFRASGAVCVDRNKGGNSPP